MYMGVILNDRQAELTKNRAPHVYGGDPSAPYANPSVLLCSPCIWG